MAASQARRTGSVAAEPPAVVRLPSGTRVPVVAVATRANGVLDVPDDVAAAGWWSGGSRVGDPFGATLLAGHVDSTEQGLGAYAELLTVRPRQRIRLSSAHLEQDFVIHSLRLIAKGDVGRDPRIWSPRGDRRLVLVTCAPPYDRGPWWLPASRCRDGAARGRCPGSALPVKGLRPWNPSRRVKVLLGLGVAAVIVAEYAVLLQTLRPYDPPEPPSATLTLPTTEPPDALRSTGAYVRSVVQPDGTIRVTQWVRVGAAVDRITLASYDPDQSGEPPVATDLDIVDASGSVVLSEGEVGTGGRTIELEASRVLRLTYDLTGAVSMSGSVPGRAIATSTALDVDYPDEGPATLEVTGAEVLTLACGGLEPDDLRPCGRA